MAKKLIIITQSTFTEMFQCILNIKRYNIAINQQEQDNAVFWVKLYSWNSHINLAINNIFFMN